MSVRLKLTLSYAGFLMIAGALLLAAVWVYLLRYVPDRAMLVNADPLTPGVFPIRSRLLHTFAPAAAVVMVFLLVVGLLGGWILAGRMLAPLARITDATRLAANGSLAHRIELEGRNDEFRELADSFDAMLAQLEAHVAEQRRFAANASHELRTPLAITRTLLEVARKDPSRDTAALVDHLSTVNNRAIDLTEALLVLSRANRGSFIREPVDLSLIAEEATEALMPLAEKHGVTIETSADLTPTSGSPALLLQLTTNLVQNAIVHNLPEDGAVWITTSAQPGRSCSRSRTRERTSPPNWSARSSSRSSAAPSAPTPTTKGSASAWRSSTASPRRTTEPSPSPPEPTEGSASRCACPPRHRAPAGDERGRWWRRRAW